MDVDSVRVEDRLEAAGQYVREERRRAADEEAALDSFADRVRERQPETVATGGAADAVAAVPRRSSRELAAVRDAYEATVMSVPHYEEEYDDTFERSVQEEFGPGVAAALVQGSAFDRRCKQVLLTAVADARERRRRLLEALDAERESLTTCTERIRTLADELADLDADVDRTRSFGTLDAYRTRLGTLEDHFTDLVEQRQATLLEQRRTLSLPVEGHDVATYVYQPHDDTYPVLAVVADLMDVLRALRDRVEHAMGYSR